MHTGGNEQTIQLILYHQLPIVVISSAVVFSAYSFNKLRVFIRNGLELVGLRMKELQEAAQPTAEELLVLAEAERVAAEEATRLEEEVAAAAKGRAALVYVVSFPGGMSCGVGVTMENSNYIIAVDYLPEGLSGVAERKMIEQHNRSD